MSVYDDIFKAARDGTVEDVKYFIEEKGVSVNSKTGMNNLLFNLGETALHVAALCGKIEIVKYLISKGADVNAKTEGGVTPLHNTAIPTESARDIASRNAPIPLLDAAIPTTSAWTSDKLEVAKILISEGADVNATTYAGNFTPLNLAKSAKMQEYLESVGGSCGKTSGGGCYVATCVYGSYDCPEVWTLRRFRDGKLSASWFGRRFIRIYYAVCPKIIKLFGNKKWFNNFWKPILNKFVCKLQNSGIDSSPYSDV
jgi:hypothetical protein